MRTYEKNNGSNQQEWTHAQVRPNAYHATIPLITMSKILRPNTEDRKLMNQSDFRSRIRRLE
jgi:hypothetical protein